MDTMENFVGFWNQSGVCFWAFFRRIRVVFGAFIRPLVLDMGAGKPGPFFGSDFAKFFLGGGAPAPLAFFATSPSCESSAPAPPERPRDGGVPTGKPPSVAPSPKEGKKNLLEKFERWRGSLK